MPPRRLLQSAGPPVRAFALLLVGWTGFFVFLNLLGAVMAPAAARRSFDPGPVELVAGLTWAVLSAAIGVYHQRLRARRLGLFGLIVAHLPLLAVASLCDGLTTSWAVRTFTASPPVLTVPAMVVLYFDFDIIAYLAIVAVCELLLLRRAIELRQRQADLLERSLSRARLDYLEAQLQPHFLFNSLGAVSELAHEAPATASRVLRQLAAVFRNALGKRTDEITLGDEIVGIEPYVDIQRIRFADWLTIDYRVEDGAADCLVPRFVLQPLIENAIRHGLSGRRFAGTIEISAAVADGSLVVRVADNGVGLDGPAKTSGRGIGLANARNRLRILYGDDDRLRLTNNEAGGAVSELRIPARRRGDANVDTGLVARSEPQLVEAFPPIRVPGFLRRRSVALVATWFVAGLLWTQQSYLYLSLRGRLNGATWLETAKGDMLSAAVWALLTPIVLRFTRVMPLRREGAIWRGVAYLVFTTVTVVVHNLIWQRVISPEIPLFSAAYEMSFIVGFLIICVLVAVGHSERLFAWLRARETDTELLRAELVAARTRAMKVQEIPPILLRALDGIAAGVGRDASLTERQLTRLADYLRLALECSDERGITPERERALHAAVVELQMIGAYSTNTLTA
jgi:two-component system LytT family sensor kinase